MNISCKSMFEEQISESTDFLQIIKLPTSRPTGS